MTDAARDLFKRALELAPADREQLARELLASIEDADTTEQDEADPAFAGDLRHRVDRALAGSDPGEDFRVVLERLRRRHEAQHRNPK
jgi:hypothetical protein